MALEIERRFLIKNDNWKEFITKKIYIEQGYLSKSLDDWISRIRFTGKEFKIAFKNHIKGFTNFEFEYSIPRSDGEIIMSNVSNKIKKERFFLEFEKKCRSKINPKTVSKLSITDLRRCGLSRMKALGIKSLADKILDKSFSPKLIKKNIF